MIFCHITTLFQNNMLTCSSDLKFDKLGMGNSYVREKGEGVDNSVAVLSRIMLEGEKHEGKWFQTGSYKKKHI
jgi:hypothetical protein